MTLDDIIAKPMGSHADMIRWHAVHRPRHLALVCDGVELDYASLDRRIDTIGSRLQAAGLAPGDIVALCAATGLSALLLVLGCIRAGIAFALLAPSAKPADRTAMLRNAEPKLLFLDKEAAAGWEDLPASTPARIAIDDSNAGVPLAVWLAEYAGVTRVRVHPEPEHPFNLIYSSGTTGRPKGIVHPWKMRWMQVMRARQVGYGPDSVTLAATPLYSNTTLVSILPTIALGGTVILMRKFDAGHYLELAQRYRATHTMLVPVQYQRLLDYPAFDQFNLSSLTSRFSAGAPFAPSLKSEVPRRWPGALIEYYGMTEGGGRCELEAHRYPHKLHTVGKPPAGNDIRMVDEAGHELPPGEVGEIVGYSAAMMTEYHRDPEKTREAEWFDASGKRFIRTGDVGRFDEDGFLVLGDRKKDMIISGGFNVYPSDIEAELTQNPAVAEAAVVGVASRAWGETPVAFVVLRPSLRTPPDACELREWVNARVGKLQRLTDLRFVQELPRNDLGKVLKRELIRSYGEAVQ